MKKLLSLVLTPALLMGSFVAVSAVSVTTDTKMAYAAPSTSELDAARQTILRDTNNIRASKGLAPLTLNPSLNTVAQNWSIKQSDAGVMSHNPDYYKQYPAGWSSAAENVAYGYSVSNVVPAWIASPGHYTNLMSASTDIGIGYYYGANGIPYFTQNFASYATTKTVPGNFGAPVLSLGSTGNIFVQWAAPYITGNSPILDYEVVAIPTSGPVITRVVPIVAYTAGGNVTLTGLAQNMSYLVKVRARNIIGYGPFTASSQITTPALMAPTAPTSVATTLSGVQQLTSTWIAPASNGGSPITSYIVNYYANGSTTPSFSVNATATEKNKTVTAINGVKAGTSYTVKVVAVNAIGSSALSLPSNVVSVPTVMTPPSTVNNLFVSSATINSLAIKWTAPSNNGGSAITGYKIVLKNSTGTVLTTLNAPSSVLNGTFNNLTAGTAYTISVSAINAIGTSTPVTVSAKTAVIPVNVWKDFTGDGKSDVVARDTSGNLWLYPSTATALGARIQVGTGWNSMNMIRTGGDFNKDGKSDVIARDTNGYLWLYPGTGSTAALKILGARIQIGGGWNSMNAIVTGGDFNKDGKSDIIARDTNGNLWLYKGTGSGTTLQVLGTRTQIGSGWATITAITAGQDLNKDGKTDILGRDSLGRLWLYPGTGTGTIAPRVQVGTGWNSMNVINMAGDYNKDGNTDIVARDANGYLWLYKGTGTGLGSRIQIGTGWNIMNIIQ